MDDTSDIAKPKRPPGSRRARDRKKLLKAAANGRPANYKAKWAKRYQALGPAPVGQPEAAPSWLSDILMVALEEAAFDPGMPPEQRREQLGRLAAQAAKVADPARLSAKLLEYRAAIEELKSHAVSVAQAGHAGARPRVTVVGQVHPGISRDSDA